MANVNLISVRRAERVRLTRITRALMLTAAGTGAVSLLLIGVMSTRLLSSRVEVRAANVELTKLRPVLQQIEADERERNQLAPKLTTLTQAQQTTQHWFGIMDSLKRAVPDETWLTNISVEKSADAQQTMKIDGETINQSRVGETMYRLTLQPGFYKKVDLRYTQTTKTETGNNVDFELAALLNDPDAAQKAGDAHAVRPTKSTIALLSGTIGLVVIVTGALAWLQQGAIDRTETELADKRSEMHDGQKIARKREEAHQALEKDRSQILYLETGVSQAAYVPTLLKQLEDLAHSTQNQVLSVRPEVVVVAPSKIQQHKDPEAALKDKSDGTTTTSKDDKAGGKTEPYTRLNIQVTMVGGYKSTQDFIDHLTRFPKIMSVDEMQIKPHRASSKGSDSAGDLLDVDMKITAFIMKESGPASRTMASAMTADAGIGGPR